MDLCCQRYGSASPFLLDGYIETGRFYEFVSEIYEMDNETKAWEIYLHKVFDKSFSEFKESLTPVEPMSKQKLEATINESKTILDALVLDSKGEGVKNGNI